jgi:TRAP-type C4-dicarboxylate transport system permease small subunit
MSALLSQYKKAIGFLNRSEEILLGLLLALMVILGLIQILFRNLVSVGLVWIDPVMRHLVLWVALLGASSATREDRHISIDLISQRLPFHYRSWLQAGVCFFSASVCWVLVLPAIRFVIQDYQAGETLARGIPLWVAQSIMPLMLLVLGLRFFSRAWKHVFSPLPVNEPIMSRIQRDEDS